MPARSKAQARLMFAAAQGDVKGVSKKVGREFTQGFKGKPGSVNKLPARKAKK